MNLRQKSTLQIVFVFLLFSLILSIVLILTQRVYFGYSNNQEIIQSMSSTLKEKEKYFKSFINQSEQTLYSIRELQLFKNYLEEEKNKKILQDMFLAYAKSQPSFMQLRYINKDGFEKIRIDRDKENQTPHLVAKNRLQNKANRYYFSDSKSKELEKVWFSALDLNIERGKVEIPYKPTLRAVLPINHNGEFGGIIIINYFMKGFIKKFVDTPLYDMIVFNSKGYPLYHYEKDKSWGYYKENKFNISEQYPNHYKQIIENSSFQADDFLSKKLDIPIYDNIYTLIKLKKSYIQEEEEKLTHHSFYTLIIIFLLAVPLSILMVKIFSRTLFNLETVKELNKNLKDLHLRNNIALTASNIGIWEWNLDTDEIIWDDHMYEIYGAKKDSNLDLKSVWNVALGEENLKSFQKEFFNNSEFNLSFWIDTLEGKRKYIKAFGVIEYDELSKTKKAVGINQDITELKKHNEELQKLNRELEESEYEIQIINENLEQQVKDKTKENLEQFEVIQQQSKLAAMGEMLGNISHQWRQPLNALSALFFNVKFKYELGKLDDETLEHFTQKSSSIIKNMNDTIDDFRDFFRPNKQKSIFNVCDSIDSVMNIMEGSFKDNNILINIECKDINIACFKSELEQVLLVVLGNSKDAIKENKISDGKILIRVYEEDDKVVVEIEDNGGGIEDNTLSRVFEPYFTTKHQDMGTGIGLYMSKMIVERSMKGTIYIQNKNSGALASIVLPKEKDDIK